ncbi:hypothetical protein Amsp01_032070 [Amycolatopsis sp. NBRC 101858]|uniref:DUF3558 domain-containing protein n=1 Tax=Amycolatopsis sp. NBRC 101858 TaxID=3032200 RepID=UPI0024A28960|nr:DUF3558 domain-containing protein [Amycolatopsis sp. NBRC 101858]GLY37183.1 hypothetical protein Amsp01_032070 [Amycolatopsis sp. NBRC 101858]
MRSEIRGLAAILVVSAGLAVACTSTTGGAASPAPSTSASTSAPASDPDVPKVTQQPLDAGKYASDTCGVLPADLLASLKYTDAGKYQAAGDTPLTAAGPSCAWKISGEGIGLQVILGTGNREHGTGGLAGTYAAYRDGKFVRFLEHAPDIEGYPAVYADIQDERPMGTCTLVVGIADDLSFSVQAQGYQGQDDSCAVANQVAAGVVKTLKGA